MIMIYNELEQSRKQSLGQKRVFLNDQFSIELNSFLFTDIMVNVRVTRRFQSLLLRASSCKDTHQQNTDQEE